MAIRHSFAPALLAAALAAGTPLAHALDLAQAWRLALEQDARIGASRAATEAARERIPQARAQFFPNISLNASRARSVSALPSSVSHSSSDFAVSPLATGARRTTPRASS